MMRCRALYFGWQAVSVRRLSPLSSSTSTSVGDTILILAHQVGELALTVVTVISSPALSWSTRSNGAP